MSSIKRFAIQHPYSGVAETQSCARIIASAKKLGIEAREIRDSEEIIAFDPDFVLSIAHQDPKLTPYPTYGVMTAPCSWYETPRFVRNILTYDAYLTVTPHMNEWLEDLKFGARKLDAETGFYANTVDCLDTTSSINFENPALVYVGTNWDGKRHEGLFTNLSEHSFLHLHGPANSWQHCEKSYVGELPFDDTTVLNTYRNAGVGLCIEHHDFVNEGMPSSRIFETLASGALAICARTSFNERWFKDCALFVDMSLPPKALSEQIAMHMRWIKNNPNKAAEMAQKASLIYKENFALDTMLTNLFDFHERVSEHKNYKTPKLSADIAPKVGVIMRAGGRGEEFLNRSISSVAKQPYENLTLFLITWKEIENLEAILSKYPNLEVVISHEVAGTRSDCMWAGLEIAKNAGCELIGVLDDDDEYHTNMIGSLVDGYLYNKALSLAKPVVAVIGGCLVAGENAQHMLVSDMVDENTIENDHSRHILHFHFGSNGQVSDGSFTAHPSAMLLVSSYLDAEIMQNPKLAIAEDYYIWLLLAERGRLAFVPEIMSTIYEHGVDQSHYQNLDIRTLRSHARLSRRVLGRHFSISEPYTSNTPSTGLENIANRVLKATMVVGSKDIYAESSQHQYKGLGQIEFIDDKLNLNLSDLTKGNYNIEAILTPEISHYDNNVEATITIGGKTCSMPMLLSSNAHPSGFTLLTTNFRVPFLQDNCAISVSIASSTGAVIDTIWDAQARQISQNPDLTTHSLADYDKIWFYGASLNGALSLKVLKEKLGMKLAGVADTYNTGIWEGFEILSPKGLLETISKTDVLVITSMHWLTIGEELKKLGIPCDVFIFNNEDTLRLIL